MEQNTETNNPQPQDPNSQDGMQTPPPSSSSSNFKMNPLLIIVMILGFALFGLGGYMLGMQNSASETSEVTENNQPEAMQEDSTSQQENQEQNMEAEEPESSSTTDGNLHIQNRDVVITDGECTNQTLGITLQDVPEGWSCSFNEGTDFLFLDSDLFAINITTGGRGLYCDPGLSDVCVATEFLENDKYNLDTYTSAGEDKEIFGFIHPVNGQEVEDVPSVSIKYEGMENNDLTPSQRAELMQVLNNLRYTIE